MTDSLQARWAHLLSILAADPAVTARQRGFVNLAQPQGCHLSTSDAADDMQCLVVGCRRTT